MSKNTVLLVIDPNNDFVDPKGSVYIPGADLAMEKLSKFILTKGDEINSIYLSQNSHLKYHITLKSFWTIGPENKGVDLVPKDNTVISALDVKNQIWLPQFHDYYKVVEYLEQLEAIGEKNIIRPDNCIYGSWGWCFPDHLVNSLNEWTMMKGGRGYSIVQRGLRREREMDGIFSYKVPREDYKPAHSGLLVNILINYERILIAGQAKDEIVANTIRTMLNNSLVDIYDVLGKLVFLDDLLTPINHNSPKLSIYQEAVDKFDAILTTSDKF